MPKLITTYADSLPIFVVCLGHQGIAEAFGAVVTRAPELLHGKTSEVTHDGSGVLAGLPDPFTATRYHSLAVVESTLPAEFEVTGRTADSGVVMAMRAIDARTLSSATPFGATTSTGRPGRRAAIGPCRRSAEEKGSNGTPESSRIFNAISKAVPRLIPRATTAPPSASA